MRLRRPLLLAALLCALSPATSHAASLPVVTDTLSATATTTATCATAAQSGAGLASTRYTAPMSGYLTIRLQGAGDWDLVMRNAEGRPERASQGFGGSEIVQTWVAAGDRIIAEGCRYAGAASTAKLTFELLDVKAPTDIAQALVRVHASRADLAGLENSGFDVSESRGPGWADVIVYGAKQLRTLRASGLKLDLRETDLAGLDDEVLAADSRAAQRTRAAGLRASDLPSGRDTYRTYEEIQAELKKIAADHPDRVKPVIIGKSYQGREVAGLEVASDVKATDGRPYFFLMGVHHAREWPSAEIAMEFANLLAKGDETRVVKATKRVRTLIVPLVNPDGYIASRSSPSAADSIFNSPIGDPTGDGTLQTGEAVAPPGGVGAYRRKNCNNEDGNASTPCEQAHGVDNNRNYGNLWGGPGSSPDLTSQAYHGQAPRSEPETQNVFNFARSNQVTTLISLHTIAGLVLRPPGVHDAGKAPDEQAMKKLGDAIGDATGYVSQFGWQLYDTSGTTEDDTYAATGGYGYTIEIGPSGGLFHGQYDINVIKQWTGDDSGKANGGLHVGLLEAAEVAAAKSSHARVGGSAPAGRVLRLHKDFDTLTSKYCLNGVDPAVSSPALEGVQCLDAVKDPITLKDSIDTTTTVPKSGKFLWHINQSTRPFVNGGAEVFTVEDDPKPIATFTGSPGVPTTSVDHEFTMPTTLGKNDKVRIDQVIAAGEDYDLELYRKDGADLVPAGTSGNAPGDNESITVDEPVKGATYVIRVVYYAAATGLYDITVTRMVSKSTFTKGHKEAYTLTCETPAGKVLESYRFVIDRGQRVDLKLACGKGKSTDSAGKPLSPATNCALPNTAPTIGCKLIPTTGGALRVSLKKAVRLQGLKKILRRQGFIATRCSLTAAGTCTVKAKIGKTKLGTGKVRMKRANTRTVKIKVSAAKRRLVARGGTLKLVAVGRAKGKKAARTTLKYKLGS
jgi:hypothetical protein